MPSGKRVRSSSADENSSSLEQVFESDSLIKIRHSTTKRRHIIEEYDIGPPDPLNFDPSQSSTDSSDKVFEPEDLQNSEDSDTEYISVGSESDGNNDAESDGIHTIHEVSDNGLTDDDERLEYHRETLTIRETFPSDDDDARYARLLQQQEIALAGSYLEMGLFGNELVNAMTAAVDDDSEEESIDMSYEALLELEENLGEVKKRGLDETGLKDLVQITFVESAFVDKEDSKSCVVCMAEYLEEDTLIKLPCEHHFHAKCVTDWLRNRATCPICRKAVNNHLSNFAIDLN